MRSAGIISFDDVLKELIDEDTQKLQHELAQLDSLPPVELLPTMHRLLASVDASAPLFGRYRVARIKAYTAARLLTAGRVGDAEVPAREGYSELAVLGASSLERVKAGQRLAEVLGALRKVDECEAVLREILPAARALGDNELSSVLGGLGVALVRQGGGAEADELLAEALAAAFRVHNAARSVESSSLLVCTLYRQGVLYANSHQPAQAERRFMEAIQIAAPLADRCPQIMVHLQANRSMLAQVWLGNGRVLEAEAMLRECHSTLCSVVGSSHPQTGIVASALARCLKARGLISEAGKLHSTALRGVRDTLGPDSFDARQHEEARAKLDAGLRTCARCGPVDDGDVKMKVCQGCKAARYCSKACSELHWKAHRPECRQIAAENKAVADAGAGPSAAA